MLRNGSASSKKVGGQRIPSGRSVKFPGIVNDAFALGVDRVTLYLARTRKRTSKKYREVLERDQELQTKRQLERSRQ